MGGGCLNEACSYSNVLASQMQYPDNYNPLFRPYSGHLYFALCTRDPGDLLGA